MSSFLFLIHLKSNSKFPHIICSKHFIYAISFSKIKIPFHTVTETFVIASENIKVKRAIKENPVITIKLYPQNHLNKTTSNILFI